MADGPHLPHLRFERTEHENPRRTRRPPVSTPPADPAGHGRRIREQVEEVEADPDAEPGFDPRLLLKLEVDNPDPDLFDPIPGLTLAGQKGKTLLVLFADEAGLNEFKARLAQLEAGETPTRKEILFAVKSAGGWTREDRIGQAPTTQGLPTTRAVVDVELWPLEFVHQRQAMLDHARRSRLACRARNEPSRASYRGTLFRLFSRPQLVARDVGQTKAGTPCFQA